jgi:hypothetical protein
LSGQFDLWLKDVLWQANRSDRLLASLGSLLQIDPALLILGFAGAIFAAIQCILEPSGILNAIVA